MMQPNMLRCFPHIFTRFGHEPMDAGFDLISDALPFGRLWYGEPYAIRQRNRLR
jgi:hypothetical protein